MKMRASDSNDSSIGNVVNVFGALADKTRLSIIVELLNGERPCAELINRFQLSKSTFSHHAKVLAKANLVSFRKEGKFLFFSLNRDILEECMYAINLQKTDKNGKD